MLYIINYVCKSCGNRRCLTCQQIQNPRPCLSQVGDLVNICTKSGTSSIFVTSRRPGKYLYQVVDPVSICPKFRDLVSICTKPGTSSMCVQSRMTSSIFVARRGTRQYKYVSLVGDLVNGFLSRGPRQYLS